MNVHAKENANAHPRLQLKLYTDQGICTYYADLAVNTLQEYRFDISEICCNITGFDIAPSIIECNGDVDWIAFENV